MCVFVKIWWFYSFTITSQSKLKKWAHYLWDIYQGKLAAKFSKFSWWTLWFADPRNFQNNFFVKSYYLNLIFFQVLQSALLNSNKNLFEKDASFKIIQAVKQAIKIAWHSKGQKKTLKKEKEKKKKRKVRNSQATAIKVFYI